MPKTIEKKEIIDIPEGKFLRVETKLSEDEKHVEVTVFYEVKTQEEIEEEERIKEETRRKKEEKERAKEQKEEDEDNTIEESNEIEPTIDDYMDALRKADEALKSLKEEERKFEERMKKKAFPPQDLPIYWSRYSEASKKEYVLSEKVFYCGKKAGLWARLGFRNICKTWKLEEYWYNSITSRNLLKRTITWQGTLEEYCENYNLYIDFSAYTCDLKKFCGTAMQNTPEGVSMWDKVEVNILE